uniref:DUF559 domain-containing protein n=1 Tax=viral metagenome TaxID=1070528 RepID=A0A6H1ZQH4_9ZZZZ
MARKKRLPTLYGIGGLKEVKTPPDFNMPRRPVRRRRGPWREQLGMDELEQRAAQGIEGTLPERIVYKALRTMNIAFNYKYGVLGTRQFRGGFEIDFEIMDRYPPVALEVLGAYWHGPAQQYKDMARALVIMGMGYRYEEITEDEIYTSSSFLEHRLQEMLGQPVMRRRSGIDVLAGLG